MDPSLTIEHSAPAGWRSAVFNARGLRAGNVSLPNMNLTIVSDKSKLVTY